MATFNDFFLHVFSFSFIVFACIFNAKHANAGNVQGMFIFGSSVVDNGNNNFNPGTIAKANYTPYGVDFPSGPTGRFSNGKNIADILAERLGLPLIPGFADPGTKGVAITHGVNFGSGGSGILDDTGSIVRLYNLGARRFVLVSVYPLGCSPVVSHGMGCLPIQNGVVSIFYDQLICMVNGLKQQLPASHIVVLNSVKLITDIINNATAA
ncbi:hypothetical protein KSS87_017376, partial [Heliosperma pusillum]